MEVKNNPGPSSNVLKEDAVKIDKNVQKQMNPRQLSSCLHKLTIDIYLTINIYT